MASAKKTSSLGLNLWEETDKPERLDFVQDNQKLEELVGAHLNSTALHLTTEEKERAKTPYKIFSFIGDGQARRPYNLSFEPSLIFVFATLKPDGIVENGLHSVYRAVKFGAFATPGLESNGIRIYLTQQTEEEALASETGYRLRLNEKGVNYFGVYFK